MNSEWRDNMAGIVPNTLDSEANPPQRDVLIAGNYVHDNNSTTADTKDLLYPSFGVGIMIAGGVQNTVVQNLVEDQATYGIAVSHPGREPLADARQRGARQRRPPERPCGSGAGRTVGRRRLLRGQPPIDERAARIETLYGCDGPSLSWFGGGDLAPTMNTGFRYLDALDGEFPHGDWRTQPAPRTATRRWRTR